MMPLGSRAPAPPPPTFYHCIIVRKSQVSRSKKLGESLHKTGDPYACSSQVGRFVWIMRVSRLSNCSSSVLCVPTRISQMD